MSKKPGRGRNDGKLVQLMDMPMDIFLEVITLRYRALNAVLIIVVAGIEPAKASRSTTHVPGFETFCQDFAAPLVEGNVGCLKEERERPSCPSGGSQRAEIRHSPL